MIKYFVLIITVFCLSDQRTLIIDSLSTKDEILNKLTDLNKVPDFTLKSYDGEEYNMRSLEGKVVLLNFWATWCYPCRLEIPELNEFHEEYEDLIVLGLSISDTKKQIVYYSLILIICSYLPIIDSNVGLVYLAIASILNLVLLKSSFKLKNTKEKKLQPNTEGLKFFILSIFYLFSLFSGLLIDNLV